MKAVIYCRVARKEQEDAYFDIREVGNKILEEIKLQSINPMMRYHRFLQSVKTK